MENNVFSFLKEKKRGRGVDDKITKEKAFVLGILEENILIEEESYNANEIIKCFRIIG